MPLLTKKSFKMGVFRLIGAKKNQVLKLEVGGSGLKEIFGVGVWERVRGGL